MTPFDISALPGKKRALYHICVLLIYAMIGWIWETVTLSAMAGHYVKRGFLILPFCLIYGFGANFILLLYRKLKKLNPAAFALVCAVIITAFELLTAFGLDFLFHTRLWSYETWPLNLNGYICLPVSIIWGIMSLFVVYVSQPLIDAVILPLLRKRAASVAVWCVFICVASEYVFRMVELFLNN